MSKSIDIIIIVNTILKCLIILYMMPRLEIGVIASPNANHFWCSLVAKHFGKATRQIFLALRITFSLLRNTFQMDSPKDFFCPHPFFRQNFPFLYKFYVRCAKMQINCEFVIANHFTKVRRNCDAIIKNGE